MRSKSSLVEYVTHAEKFGVELVFETAAGLGESRPNLPITRLVILARRLAELDPKFRASRPDQLVELADSEVRQAYFGRVAPVLDQLGAPRPAARVVPVRCAGRPVSGRSRPADMHADVPSGASSGRRDKDRSPGRVSHLLTSATYGSHPAPVSHLHPVNTGDLGPEMASTRIPRSSGEDGLMARRLTPSQRALRQLLRRARPLPSASSSTSSTRGGCVRRSAPPSRSRPGSCSATGSMARGRSRRYADPVRHGVHASGGDLRGEHPDRGCGDHACPVRRRDHVAAREGRRRRRLR